MTINRETRANKAIQAEFDVPRFFWDCISGWQKSRSGDRAKRDHFWDMQKPVLEDFDRRHPNHFRIPGAGPIRRTELPRDPPVGVMIASNMRKPRSPPPSPLPPVSPRPPTPGPSKRRGSPSAPAPVPVPVQEPASPVPGTGSLRRKEFRGTIRRPITGGDDDVSKAAWANNIETDYGEKQVPSRMETDPDPAPAPAAVSREEQEPAPAPAPSRSTKGKEKMTSRDEERKEESSIKVKGKARMVVEEDEQVEEPSIKVKVRRPREEKANETIEDQTSTAQGGNARPAPKTNGKERNPECVRCVNAKRTCLEQSGTGYACYQCAKVKMRCIPVGDQGKTGAEESKVAGMSKKPVKRKKPVVEPQPVPVVNPVPVPVWRRKPVVTPSMVASSESEGEVASRPRKNRKLDDCERLDGMF